MKKNKIIIDIVIVILALICGFFIGKTLYDKPIEHNVNIEKYIKKEEELSDKQNNKTDIIVEEIEKRSPAQLENIKSGYCKKIISELDFSNDIDYYCYEDICSTDFNKVVGLIKRNSDLLYESIKNKDSDILSIDDIYNINIFDGRIIAIKNGEVNEKYNLGNISNIKSFRLIFDESFGKFLLYVLDNKNNVYEYDIDNDWEEVTNKRLVYKNVKDFDIIDGNDYEKCFSFSEKQNIQIVLHTKNGKVLYGSPF